MSNQTHATLYTGAKMPHVGLGTWKSKAGEVEAAVKAAIDAGYRHIDCAFAYGNEAEVGAAIADRIQAGVVKREDLFVTSKLWNTKHHKEDVIPSLKTTLASLQLDYVDLYLVHWPHAFQRGEVNMPRDETGDMLYDMDVSYMETWPVMEEAVDAGLTRHIGLSNFNSQQINEVYEAARIKPAVLQIESHPYLTQQKLIAHCEAKNIIVTAYSPLGSPDRPWAKPEEPTLLEDEKILAIAKVHNKTAAQVCIRFQVQRNVVVIPKSVTPSRIATNVDVFDFTLSDAEMGVIGAFDRNFRFCLPKKVVNGVEMERDAAHPLYPFNIEY